MAGANKYNSAAKDLLYGGGPDENAANKREGKKSLAAPGQHEGAPFAVSGDDQRFNKPGQADNHDRLVDLHAQQSAQYGAHKVRSQGTEMSGVLNHGYSGAPEQGNPNYQPLRAQKNGKEPTGKVSGFDSEVYKAQIVANQANSISQKAKNTGSSIFS